MDDWDGLKAELLADPATKEAYESRRPAFELASQLIRLRTTLGLSQRQLAARAHMTQPEIARLEAGQVQPTWETVSRVLDAAGAELDIKVRDQAGKLVRLTIARGTNAAMAPAVARRRSRKVIAGA